MDLKKYGEILPELERQSQTAKAFYAQDIYLHLRERTNDSLELAIMRKKISVFSSRLKDSIFLHLGAGKGRFVNELLQTCQPKRSIVIDISSYVAEDLKQLEKFSQGKIKYLESNFLEINLDISQDVDILFIFMNWSVLAETSSKRMLAYFLERLGELHQRVILIGDMPEQINYIIEQREYAFKHGLVELGVMDVPTSLDTKDHLNYIPDRKIIEMLAIDIGFDVGESVLYNTAAGQSRYFFEFRKNI